MLALLFLAWLSENADTSAWPRIWEGFVWRLTAAVVWGVVCTLLTTVLAAFKAKRPGEFRSWFWRIGATLFCAGVALYLIGGLALRTLEAHFAG